MEFHSLDMDPEQAIYGPPGRHVIGSVTDMSGYYDEASFDVVISNGVIGWGLNERIGFERMMEQCHRVLKPGGLLILGYNDTPGGSLIRWRLIMRGCLSLSCRRFGDRAFRASDE